MLIDIHCHLADEKYDNTISEIIENANQNGVEKLICIGTDKASSIEAVNIAKAHKNVYACIGLYPEYANEYTNELDSFFREIGKNEKVVGIGEIGLDYHTEGFDKDAQKECFIKQLKIAYDLHLPIEIHCREAMGEMIDILRENKNLLAFGGVMHCFNGSKEIAEEIIKLGLSLSIGGTLTFKNSRAIKETVCSIPLEKIVFETDSPYLAPEPFRGTVNEPKNVKYICDYLAKLKNTSFEEVCAQTTKNVFNIFKRIK